MLSFYISEGAIGPSHPTMVPGSGIDSNMSFTAYDSRTGNVYAIHEGSGPGEDTVSRWMTGTNLSVIQREQGRCPNYYLRVRNNQMLNRSPL